MTDQPSELDTAPIDDSIEPGVPAFDPIEADDPELRPIEADGLTTFVDVDAITGEESEPSNAD